MINLNDDNPKWERKMKCKSNYIIVSCTVVMSMIFCGMPVVAQAVIDGPTIVTQPSSPALPDEPIVNLPDEPDLNIVYARADKNAYQKKSLVSLNYWIDQNEFIEEEIAEITNSSSGFLHIETLSAPDGMIHLATLEPNKLNPAVTEAVYRALPNGSMKNAPKPKIVDTVISSNCRVSSLSMSDKHLFMIYFTKGLMVAQRDRIIPERSMPGTWLITNVIKWANGLHCQSVDSYYDKSTQRLIITFIKDHPTNINETAVYEVSYNPVTKKSSAPVLVSGTLTYDDQKNTSKSKTLSSGLAAGSISLSTYSIIDKLNRGRQALAMSCESSNKYVQYIYEPLTQNGNDQMSGPVVTVPYVTGIGGASRFGGSEVKSIVLLPDCSVAGSKKTIANASGTGYHEPNIVKRPDPNDPSNTDVYLTLLEEIGNFPQTYALRLYRGETYGLTSWEPLKMLDSVKGRNTFISNASISWFVK